MKQNKKNLASKKLMPIWAWIFVAVAVLAVVGFAVLQQIQPQVASLPLEITVDQAAQKQNQGAFILDVREPDEWDQLHIPGASLIPLADLPNRLSEVPQDREVVVVCRSGNRSAAGRDILLDAGYAKVTSMAGGMNQWQAKGLPIATGQ